MSMAIGLANELIDHFRLKELVVLIHMDLQVHSIRPRIPNVAVNAARNLASTSEKNSVKESPFSVRGSIKPPNSPHIYKTTNQPVVRQPIQNTKHAAHNRHYVRSFGTVISRT